MNLFSKLLGAFLLMAFSTASQAQNYYVCDTGDDANDGKSEKTPFKTYEKAIDIYNGMFAGSSVLFCRGGVFPVTQDKRIYNSKCGATNRCTLADYGDSSKPKPIISTTGQTALNFQEGGNADPDGGYLIKNLALIAKERGKGAGVFIYNDVDDLVLDNLHIEGYRIGVHSSGSNALNPGTNGFNDRLVLSNSTIINNYYQGFLGACQDCLIENNHFENNGYANKILNHNIYVAKSGKPAVGITIRNNVLYKSAIVEGKCSGVSLVAHGLLNDLVIENNLVKEDLGKVTGFCWGISVDPGYSHEEEAFYNVTIKNNKLVNVGNVAIGCASCEGVTITGNEIIDEGNVLRAGIKIPVREENVVKSKDITISNNRIITTHLDANGISIGGQYEAKVTNNEIIQANDSKADCIDRWGANALTNIISNSCKFHSGISIIDLINDHAESDEESIVENSPVNETSENQESDVVENQPVGIEPPEQEVVENQPVDNDLPEQQIVDNSKVNEQTENASDLSDSDVSQQPAPVVVEPDNFVITDKSPQDTTSSAISVKNASEVTTDQQFGETTTFDTVKKSRNISGGGASSGGGPSKSNKASSTELVGTDEVISYTTPNSSIDTATNIMSVETEQMDITSSLPKTETESSKYSVKVKDVIEASRQNNDDIDVSQCRAYAAGRCLMK